MTPGDKRMVIIFNETTVSAKPDDNGATRQHLLTDACVPGTGIHLDRLTLGPGCVIELIGN